MNAPAASSASQLRAVILAAGGVDSQTRMPWVMQSLDGRPILDHVVELAVEQVDPSGITIVIPTADAMIADHLGSGYRYVTQDAPGGTGHAVHQTQAHLADYRGPLLILYGDTALLRRSSILGLVTRHRLKRAGMTLLSAKTDQALPYGRIVRNQMGYIVDVVEQADATVAEEQIRELNIGAYVVETAVLWPALRELHAVGEPGVAQLTDVVRLVVRSGHPVDAYCALDEDELLGVNTVHDLEHAALILRRRQLRPRRAEEQNLIHFGTGGWRARIGEGFTLDNVRRLCQALANEVIRSGREAAGVVIGYDRRFLSDSAAHSAAEVFAGNNVRVLLQRGDVPTPLITYATAQSNAAFGLMFTASHNPPQWNGLKVFAADGSLPLDEETARISSEANRLTVEQLVKIELETGLKSGMAQEVDFTNDYVDAVEALIDLQIIRAAELHVVLDAMHGVGQVTLEIILTEARCRVTTIRGRHDPLFGGRTPAPDAHQLGLLMSTIHEGSYNLGLAMDGDADRIAIIDDRGAYISTNELLLILYHYLHEVRGMRGGVARNLATTHLLDRLAARYGESAYETPVGFKHLAAAMKTHDVLLAGESSGGLSIRGHILGKDGIFACALVVEMLARTGRTVVEMLEEIYGQIGRLVSAEASLPATPEMRVLVQTRLDSAEIDQIAQYPVVTIGREDGIKLYLENDSWLLLRFSGTEPLLRIFAEADSQEKVEDLMNWAHQLIGA